MIKYLCSVTLIMALVATLSSCGGGSDGTTSGGGQADSGSTEPPVVKVVGPNLNGEWSGYYYTDKGTYPFETLTATITHSGEFITVVTTKMGIGGTLAGKIDSRGDMLLTDPFDGQRWTTLYQPAKTDSIFLADFIKVAGVTIDTQTIVLKR